MKIVVNCFDLLESHAGSGGAGSYIISLLKELARSAEVRVICSARNAGCFDQDAGYTFVRLRENSYMDVAPQLDWGDVYFCPLNGLSPPFIDCRVPIVCTILDLQQIHFPNLFGAGVFEARHIHYGAAISRADAVLTISDFERNNIRRAYGKDAVYVSYLSGYLADAVLSGEITPGAQFEDLPWDGKVKYLLYPAVPWPHKNHTRLLQAFDWLLRRSERLADLKLVLTGARQHSLAKAAFGDVIEHYRLGRHVADLGFINDESLAWLIINAEALVFPSLYEGFGIPVVDAMKLGVPTLAAPSGAVPEVCGDAIAYFSDPLDARALAADLESFIEDLPRREALSVRAKSKGAEYSGARTAEATLQCFEEVVAARRNGAMPQIYLPTRPADYLPRETVTVVLDATGFTCSGAASAELDRLLDGIGKIADSVRWIIVMEETEEIPAMGRLPPTTRRSYVRPDLVDSRAVQLMAIRDETIATEQMMYLRLDQLFPEIFHELGYATALLGAFPEIGGVRFDPHSEMLWIDMPRTDKALIQAYENWRNRPLSFFQNLLLRRTGSLAPTYWARDGVREVLGKLQIMVLPLRKAEAAP